MELVKWNNVKKAIAECKTIDEVKQIRDKAEALRLYKKQIGESLSAQNDMAEIKLRAERQAGKMLKEMPKNKGGRSTTDKLSVVGIQHHESSRWQKIADIPEDKFEHHIIEVKEENKELTQAGMLRLEKEIYRKKARKEKDNIFEEKKESNQIIKGLYNIIYIDPPWKYPSDKGYYGQDVERHYPTMTIEELQNLNIKQYADKDCVLYMWATASLLDVAIDLLRYWGFDYKTCLIWDKVKHNMGFYASIRHEILLIGGIGQSAPTDKKYANQTDSVYVEERTKHSRKPAYYYKMIEKLHLSKKRKLEFFARSKRDNWVSWGNEV